METLNDAIGYRVVCASAEVFAAQELEELGPKSGFKLSSPVCGDGGRHTKTCDPSRGQCAGHCFSSHISHGKCLWPPSKTINTGQQVGLPFGWR